MIGSTPLFRGLRGIVAPSAIALVLGVTGSMGVASAAPGSGSVRASRSGAELY